MSSHANDYSDQSGDDVDAANIHGVTALMRAAEAGELTLVQALLQQGADPNRSRNDGFTPLLLAAFFGHTEIVRVLMQHGADLNRTTRHGTSAQMWASARTFKDVVDYLQKPDRPIQPAAFQATSSQRATHQHPRWIRRKPLLQSRLVVICAAAVLIAASLTATSLELFWNEPQSAPVAAATGPTEVVKEQIQHDNLPLSPPRLDQGIQSPIDRETRTTTNQVQNPSKVQLAPVTKVMKNTERLRVPKQPNSGSEKAQKPIPVLGDSGTMARYIVTNKPKASTARPITPPGDQLISPSKGSAKPGKVIAWP